MLHFDCNGGEGEGVSVKERDNIGSRYAWVIIQHVCEREVLFCVLRRQGGSATR